MTLDTTATWNTASTGNTASTIHTAAGRQPGDTLAEFSCRSCRRRGGPDDVVLDLGRQPSAKHFPAADAARPDPRHALAMWLCPECGLAQLLADTTNEPETIGLEPRALRDQAAAAVADCVDAGLLPASGRVREFPSPHGGSWLPQLVRQGLEPVTGGVAEVLIDSFGIMHEPDQRAAFAARAGALAPGGVLLLHYHPLTTIVAQHEWNALRHGHYAYYTAAALGAALAPLDLVPVRAFGYDLYGGTVLLAIRHRRDLQDTGIAGAPDAADDSVARLLDEERAHAVADPRVLAELQRAASRDAARLRGYLQQARSSGRRVLGYGAASRAITQLVLAGVDTDLLPAVADGSPAKQGRLLPGSRLPIISPQELIAADPDEVLVLLPTLAAELAASHPRLEGRITTITDAISTNDQSGVAAR